MPKLAINGGKPAVTLPAPDWPPITERDIQAVADAFRRVDVSFPGGGGALGEFEKRFAETVGRSYCIGVNGGTAALDIAVHVSGAGPGDEVIVSPYSWGATVGCILHNNAIPVFADIDPDTFTIDPKSIAEKVTDRTKAIVVVHIFGHPADMDPIMEIARRHDLLVIEDCAQAAGTLYKGRPCGSLGHVGCFSFHAGKNYGAGEGGAVLFDDEELYHRALLYGTHPTRHVELSDKPYYKYSDSLGPNFRMHGLAAVMAMGQLAHLSERTKIRNENQARLSEALRDIPGVEPPWIRPETVPSFHLYPMKYKAHELGGLPRTAFMAALNAEGVGVGSYVKVPIHLRPCHREHVYYGKGCPWECPLGKGGYEYKEGDCPVAEHRCAEEEMDIYGSNMGRECSEWLDQIMEAFRKVAENADQIPRDAVDDGTAYEKAKSRLAEE